MIITPHFTYEEFAQPAAHGLPAAPYPKEWIDSRLRPLCEQLEIIRLALGRPMKIVSGYRSPAYNAAVPGTAKASQHIQGKACDVVVPGLKASRAHAFVLDLYNQGKLPLLGGLGFYGDRFFHMDIRTTKRLVRWTGSSERKSAG